MKLFFTGGINNNDCYRSTGYDFDSSTAVSSYEFNSNELFSNVNVFDLLDTTSEEIKVLSLVNDTDFTASNIHVFLDTTSDNQDIIIKYEIAKSLFKNERSYNPLPGVFCYVDSTVVNDEFCIDSTFSFDCYSDFSHSITIEELLPNDFVLIYVKRFVDLINKDNLETVMKKYNFNLKIFYENN